MRNNLFLDVALNLALNYFLDKSKRQENIL